MFRATIIGNLGADARVENNNGRPFVSFSVAHNDRYTKEDGTVVDKQQWISCALNGDGGALLPYLKRGRQVYVEGKASTRIYSSEKERRMVAGVNINVDHLELIGGQSDDVPSRLFDSDGIMHNVKKSYWIEQAEASIILGNLQQSMLTTPSGQRFILTAPCWVTPESTPAPIEEQEQEPEVFDGTSDDTEAKELQKKMRNSKS